MDPKFWLETWEENEIRFHQDDTEPRLKRYFADIKPGRIFVPLCGKSLDMLWLIKKGWEVIGVELSPIASEAFFKENQIPCEKQKVGPFDVYVGKNIKIFCGDLFELKPEYIGSLSAVYDRACIIALPPEMRKKYAAHLKSILSLSQFDEFRWLLLSMEYPQQLAEPPPHSVERAELDSLFLVEFKIQELERAVQSQGRKGNPKFDNVAVLDTAYFLTNRK